MPKKTLSRYVYLNPVRLPIWDLRWIAYRAKGQSLWKIGVAVDVDQRTKKVDNSHKSVKVKTKYKYYVPSATKHESYLHKEFESQKFEIIGLDGGTEVYRLSPKQLDFAKRYLRKQQHLKDRIGSNLATLIFTIILIIIFIVLHFKPTL